MHPLDDRWRDAVEATLRARKWPGLADVDRLGPLVARLSASYNQTGTAARELLPARLAFSFARDLPKGSAAVRELVSTGLLTCPADRPLRVLDVGAGLGATTWGVAGALEAAGQRGVVEATWVDADDAALSLGLDLQRARGETRVAVKPTIVARALGRPGRGRSSRGANSGGPGAPSGYWPSSHDPFDLVVLGQVLSELDASADPDERVARHAALVRALLSEATRPDGALVVIEPALRDRTRHLHAVRDALLADELGGEESAGAAGISVFAPCLHAHRCPALAGPSDWCHEDLPVDLPPWLAPIARAAGLRWEGLTFSYLVLRRDGRTLAERGFPWRVVSGPIVSKGKRELFLCGAAGEGAARLRVQRIDRHASDANAAWDSLARGDRVRLDPAPSPPLGRVTAETRVDVDGSTQASAQRGPGHWRA